MENLRFEALPARFGDCLLISVPGAGATNRPVRMLVDGGPSRVFATSLSERLKTEQREARTSALDADRPVEIDAVMVSHVDDDHVVGLNDLFDGELEARQRDRPGLVKVRYLLHNSFDALIGEGEGGAARALGGETVLADFGGAIKLGNHNPVVTQVLASYAKGSKLASLAAALGIERNPPDRSVISFEQAAPRILRLGEARLAIIGPLGPEIDKLQEKWKEWRIAEDKKTGLSALAAYVDTSVPNLSSIVAMLVWKGRRILLTGDARGDRILEGLKEGGFFKDGDPVKVDILKLPHHGSSHNVDVDFFQRIHADHYIVSGDGTYGNPDREMFEMLEKARPDGGFTVHLTYSATDCDATHTVWIKNRKGGPFDPDKHAITDIIERWKKEKKIEVLEGPVSIALGAPVPRPFPPAGPGFRIRRPRPNIIFNP